MTIPNYIDGSWVKAAESDTLPVTNPATGEPLGRVPLSSGDDVARAVAAAGHAFPAWRNTPVAERVQVLFRLKALLEQHQEELATLMTRVVRELTGS